jgi:nitrous oxidase accessory protein NosD
MKKKLVLVKWHDACNTGEWHTDQEVDEWLKDSSFECENVGYLIRETKDFIVLAARVSWGDKQYGLLEKLPRKMIDKIITL